MSRSTGAPDEPAEEAGARRGRRFARRDPGEAPALSEDELEQLDGEALPYREAMSVLDANVAIPLNPSVAADVLSGEPGAPPEEPGPAPDR